MFTDYLVFMVHISGTIFFFNSIDVSYACFKDLSKIYTQASNIPYRII